MLEGLLAAQLDGILPPGMRHDEQLHSYPDPVTVSLAVPGLDLDPDLDPAGEQYGSCE